MDRGEPSRHYAMQHSIVNPGKEPRDPDSSLNIHTDTNLFSVNIRLALFASGTIDFCPDLL